MKNRLIPLLSASALGLLLSVPSFAGPRETLLDKYAGEARAANAAFSGFSAARGKTLHTASHTGGKADTPSCTTCHGNDPRSAGRTAAGKVVEPVAVSANASRYTDPAKVEKWFKRNCNEVLGRECSAQEKGDWLSFMFSQ